MQTKIKTKKGKIIDVCTQQYVTGLYVIVNNDPSQQFVVKKSEEKFHIDLRKKALKNEDFIVDGTILAVSSKLQHLNQFTNE